ncbi:MAG: hypothetical protein GQ574_08795 [Crocinitomix sp.]|nr:hypothetical protein [Crocinitomix sp.]
MREINFDLVDNFDLNLWYCGKFNDSLTEYLIEMSSADSGDVGLGKSKKRVSFLMAESFQNIVRHGNANEDKEIKGGGFGIFNRNEKFHIFSSNSVSLDQAAVLEEQLSELSELDQDELKKRYLDKMRDGSFSDKGGAGLGLIEMARKSGNQIQYSFTNEANNQKEFNLQIDKALSKEEGEKPNLKIAESIDFLDSLRANGVLLLFKGDFDNEYANNLIHMLMENILKDEKEGYKMKVIFHIAIELIQNISRHGLKINGVTQGIFMLKQHNNSFEIVSKNYLSQENIEKLNKEFLILSKKSNIELVQIYKDRIRKNARDESKSGGVGLIDVMKYTNGQFAHVVEDKKTEKELTLTATVEL